MKRENLPEYILHPSATNRQEADRYKEMAKRAAEVFDSKFNVEELTGYKEQYKKLWMAYFAAYWAAGEFHNPDIQPGYLDSVVKMPVFGRLWKIFQSSEIAGNIAWLELWESAEMRAKKQEDLNKIFKIRRTANVLCMMYRDSAKSNPEILRERIISYLQSV